MRAAAAPVGPRGDEDAALGDDDRVAEVSSRTSPANGFTRFHKPRSPWQAVRNRLTS